jgi:hypothetical protein
VAQAGIGEDGYLVRIFGWIAGQEGAGAERIVFVTAADHLKPEDVLIESRKSSRVFGDHADMAETEDPRRGRPGYFRRRHEGRIGSIGDDLAVFDVLSSHTIPPC